ncbi:MAG: permease [Anaerolineae bacterium]
MPADLWSTSMLILVTAADAVLRLWPYVAGGILLAVLLPRLARDRAWQPPGWLPHPLALPLAALLGIASPLPTLGMMPLALQLRGTPGRDRASLAFLLASSLLNPHLFVLTLGVLGLTFALAQAGAVLALGVTLGWLFGRRLRPAAELGAEDPPAPAPGYRPGLDVAGLAGHIVLYFLVGVTAGAALQVLLPRLGLLQWLGNHGWLSTPILGWLGAPFYTCGGSAVPLAGGLAQAGFRPGTLFAFLLLGPALRGSTLATLGCLLPRRALLACLALLALAGGLLGLGLDHVLGMV